MGLSFSFDNVSFASRDGDPPCRAKKQMDFHLTNLRDPRSRNNISGFGRRSLNNTTSPTASWLQL
ncbi:TBL2 isoform 15 [Pan troglodytes]|uniref:TBL2 isoform 15 n=1 Tax=Pan troglodytes TaxID=9598 RepID=A0A2J8Q8G9_PANTR|nr:TBL2 isoform 15 [Pan troglodytes]